MNKNTKRARELGFSSWKDKERGGHRIMKGNSIKTSWPQNGKDRQRVYPKGDSGLH